ncbi:alpha/beta hydrolase [Actinoallomurus bryophytorum]|uniref:alpha/beta hydrolase n=1 Tax=Actinoallomurus bryophytorum TaxID=1490222 RepID=UPI001151817E|nr:alpha/beta hydrolase [Actinoallomurus bryophytorum]
MVLLLIAVVAVVTSGSHAANRHEATYSYGTQVRQGIDAYWYDADTPHPALLILHGGYYDSGSKSDWTSTARYFADHGFAVFAADYRYDTDAEWPGPRDDAIAAAGWIKDHAEQFDADPTHLAVLGSQAGGQLATALATYGAGRTRVDAAVGLSPINSPYRAWTQAPTGSATAAQRKIRDETVVLNRCYPDKTDTTCWRRWTDSIAGQHASGADDAPMYLIHSTGDTIPAVHSTDLRAAELARGMDPADITVQTLGGSGSGGPLLTAAVKARILIWLRDRAQGIAPPAPRTPRRALGTAAQAPVHHDDHVPVPPATEGLRALTAGTLTADTFPYGTDPKQQLDAYYAPTTARRPALVIIHGGYWYEDDKSSWASTALWYAERGYAVFSINYRLNTTAVWPAQRDDALSAISWIKGHATTFDIDPDRVMLLGSSAGGQIAASVGTYGTGTSRVRGVVALSPVASPYRSYKDGDKAGATASERKLRDNSTLLAGCHPTTADAACWSRWTDSVVKNHVSRGDAPMFLLHSKGDFVPSTHSADLCAALKDKKVGCTLDVVGGDGHAGALLKTAGVHAKILTWLQTHDR